MNKKRVTALAVSLSLVAVIGIGATLAYFTDQTDTQNVINMGHVDIDLVEHEITQDEDGNWVYDETKPVTSEELIFTDVYPGETVAKDPTVTLAEGSGDAYIRVKMEIDISDSSLTPNDAAALKANIDKEIAKSGKWYEATDGYYYYNTALTEEDSSAVLFDKVTLPGAAWKNNTASQSFQVKLEAEAIQSKYFTPQTGDGMITGWIDETQAPITAEAYTE